MEVVLKDHPARLAMPAELDRRRIKKRGREFFLDLSPNDENDHAIFRFMHSAGTIALNGEAATDLARFHPGFGDADAIRILAYLKETRTAMAALSEEVSTKNAEAAICTAAVDENAEPDRVETLFEAAEQKAREARLAEKKLETNRRRLEALESQLKTALERGRQAEFERVRGPVQAAVDEFNETVEAARKKVRQLLDVELPKLAALSTNAAPCAQEIVYVQPLITNPQAMALMTLRAVPQITWNVRKNSYEFVISIREAR
jgi:hypothetical protein